MTFYKVREQILQGKNITNICLRVTFYARVSTESLEQLNSLENQISYFKNYITSNSNWTYVDGYIDEGISGSSVKKRKNFLKMMEDAKRNCFDLIITKEVSRFSRNLSDSIKYTQELMINNVGVYFQSNGINTYDPNSEFILNMMGSVAQEEVKRLSERVKWGHKEAIKKGRVLGSNSITGYKKDNAKLVIVESEAKVVRKIFELYATGNYGFYKLGIELHKLGINNSKGNIYDKDTLKRIIENPKYKGFYCGHITETIDYKTKKRVSIPIEERVIYKDERIPSIVDEDLWERANKILRLRSSGIKNKNISNKKVCRKYAYSGKIFCYDHNSCFQRIINYRNKKIKWACGNYIKYGLENCKSPIIEEIDLDNIFIDIMNNIFYIKNNIVKEMMSYYSNVEIVNDYLYDIKKISDKIDEIKNKKEKILELTIDGNLNNLEFYEKNEVYNREIEDLKNKIAILKKEQCLNIFTEDNLKNIKESICNVLNFNTNIQAFVKAFLDEIIVSKIDNNRYNIKMDIFLNLSNITEVIDNGSKYLKDLDNYLPTYSSTFFNKIKQNKYIYNVYFK